VDREVQFGALWNSGMEDTLNGKRAPDTRPTSPRKRRRTRFAAAPAAPPAKSLTPAAQEPSSAIDPAGSSPSSLGAAAVNGAAVPRAKDGQQPAPPSRAFSSVVDVSAIPVAPVSTLKINQQVARREKIKRDLKSVEADLLETDPTRNAYFSFVDPSAITAKAEKDRRRAEMRAADALFRETMEARAAEFGSLPPLPPLAEGTLDSRRSGATVPQVEWWDAPFINTASLERVSKPREGTGSPRDQDHAIETLTIREDKITHYVHHPIRVASAKADKPVPVMPLQLTEKERKRLRRQKRLERETERREMVAVGLLPPPPPKVKLSNLMRVLANEASADPTQVESDVRAQVAERQRKHIADNEARRKTKPELRDKAEATAKADRESGLHANVYRILSLENAQHKYKIDVNARQLQLTGALVEYADCNMVIVEGGPKALRKYKALMLRRIDWNLPSTATGERSSAQRGDPRRENRCALIWEGPIASPAFDKFKSVKLPTENGVKSFLKRRHVESYFELALAWC
jgi:U4/U6 small nuclear ribonucleoprotein PRP3